MDVFESKKKMLLSEEIDPRAIKASEDVLTAFLSGGPLSKKKELQVSLDLNSISNLTKSYIAERRRALVELFSIKGWSLVHSVLDSLDKDIREESLKARDKVQLLDVLVSKLQTAQNREGNTITETTTRRLDLSDEALDSLIREAQKVKERQLEDNKIIDIETE